MKSKKKKKSILKVGFSIVLLFLSFFFFILFQVEKKEQIPQVEKLIKEKEKIHYQDSKENKINPTTYVNTLPSVRQEYQNENIMGRLEVPNLNIDSYITRTINNEYYLNNNLYNQYDGLGVPFFDYRNTDLKDAKQINIYGHNTRNEKYFDVLPFINLEAYTDQNIFDNYKDIFLSIDERQIHYKVIAIKIITEEDNEHMKVLFHSEEDFLNHTTKLLQNTLYKEDNLEITKDDNLLVLQACHFNPPDTYLLVIAKEV